MNSSEPALTTGRAEEASSATALTINESETSSIPMQRKVHLAHISTGDALSIASLEGQKDTQLQSLEATAQAIPAMPVAAATDLSCGIDLAKHLRSRSPNSSNRRSCAIGHRGFCGNAVSAVRSRPGQSDNSARSAVDKNVGRRDDAQAFTPGTVVAPDHGLMVRQIELMIDDAFGLADSYPNLFKTTATRCITLLHTIF